MDERIYFTCTGCGNCECLPCNGCCHTGTAQVTVLRGTMGPQGPTEQVT